MEFLTNKQVLDIYNTQEGNPTQKSASTYTILEQLCKDHGVAWKFGDNLYNRERKVFNLAQKRQTMRKSPPAKIQEFENGEFVKLEKITPPVQTVAVSGKRRCDDDPEYTETASASSQQKSIGRRKKRLSENPCQRTSNSILDGILDNLKCVADEHKISINTLLRALTDRCLQRNTDPTTEPSSRETPPDMCLQPAV